MTAEPIQNAKRRNFGIQKDVPVGVEICRDDVFEQKLLQDLLQKIRGCEIEGRYWRGNEKIDVSRFRFASNKAPQSGAEHLTRHRSITSTASKQLLA